jgi:DNA primase
MIPEKSLQEIQDRLDIVEVIGQFLPLKKAGRNFKGLCPFHPEKTPSFMVYPDKQFFICYGCKVGGDMIAFVMRHEQMDFQEAVLLLAEKAGVAVARVGGGSVSKQKPELNRTMELADRFYHDLLMKSPEAEAARAYLQERNLTPETWKSLRIGYAPSQWDRLLKEGTKEKIAPELLEKAGLVIRREGAEGGFYDRFRNRVLFPISDSRGRVIGFGGRTMEVSENSPKYINSPETDLYIKSNVLYGYHWAASQVRERDFCIVVEGYMDCATPFQHGLRNVVASMGTSLTQAQVRLIKRQTRHVVMVYDSDYAGQMATLRGLDLFLESEIRVKIAALPAGQDPDSLIREKGLEPFLDAIRKSKDLFDYKLGLLKQQFDPRDVAGQVRICEEMLPTLKKVPNAILRAEYIKRLSAALGLEESVLWTELKRLKAQKGSREPVEVQLPTAPVVNTAEDHLASLLLEDLRRIEDLKGRLDLEDLHNPDVKHLVMWLQERHQKGTLPAEPQALMAAFPREGEAFQAKVAQWLAHADAFEDADEALDKTLERIEASRHRASIEGLQISIREAEAAGDEKRATQLILEINRLVRERTMEHVQSES